MKGGGFPFVAGFDLSCGVDEGTNDDHSNGDASLMMRVRDKTSFLLARVR